MTWRRVTTFGLVAGFALALEIACRAGLVKPTVLLPPSEIIEALYQQLLSGAFTSPMMTTLSNVAVSALVAIVAGLIIGVVIQASALLRAGIEPFLASYYAVPTFIFYPVLVVLFGVGGTAILAIAVLLAVVAMITATLSGLDQIPPVFVRSAKILRMPFFSTVLLIKLPAAAPYLFTGARLSVAYAFIGVIASEFILSDRGLGYEIAYAYNNFENRKMYALMLLIIIVASAVNSVLNYFDDKLQLRLRR